MENPKAAIDAILEDDKKTSSSDLEVKTLTLGRYALLDALESPLVSKKSSSKLLDLIPTLYVMASDWKDLVGYNTSSIGELKAKALEWAGDKDLSAAAVLVEEIVKKLGLLSTVSPEPNEDTSRKKEDAAAQTAG